MIERERLVQELHMGSARAAHTPSAGAAHESITLSNLSINNSVQNEFARWWEVYPKKKSKIAALKAWKKIKPDADVLIADTENRKREEESWQRDNGQFIPLPATYLLGERWNDEITPTPERAASLPDDDNKLQSWALSRGIREARPGESTSQYRQAVTEAYRRLQ